MIAAGCRARVPTETRDVTFTSRDGVVVHATLYSSGAERPPALLLLHMLGSDRHAWDAFARAAVRHGYLVLAMDLRGHGNTSAGGGFRLSFGGITPVPTDRILEDIEPAVKYLLDSGADPDNLFIAGASIGSNLALRYAARDPRIQATVLLSPGEDYQGVTVYPELKSYSNRPLMILAAEGDSFSASTARKMKAVAKNYCELRLYPGSAHGTDILDAHRASSGQILLWLEPILKRNPPAG